MGGGLGVTDEALQDGTVPPTSARRAFVLRRTLDAAGLWAVTATPRYLRPG